MTERIEIVCDDRSHAGRTARVETFVKVAGEWGRVYGGRRVANGPKERDDVEARGRSPHGQRYRLECDLCGLSTRARATTLHPVLDTLADAGVSPITLTALAGRVSG